MRQTGVFKITCIGLTWLSNDGKPFDADVVSSFELFTIFYKTVMIYCFKMALKHFDNAADNRCLLKAYSCL